MQYIKARSFHRFMAFLIDSIIISIITSLIISLIPYFNRQINLFINYFNEGINAMQSNADELANEYLDKAYDAISGYFMYYVLVALPVWYIYYVVIAHFWPKQTIGRMLFRLVVVRDGTCEVISFGRRSWREIAGYFLYQVLAFSFIFVIINIVLSSTRFNTLCDMVSGTNLVYIDSITKEVKDEVHGDAIDAKVEDLNNNKGEYKVF